MMLPQHYGHQDWVMATAVTQQNTPEGGTQKPPAPQKPQQQSEQLGTGPFRGDESPRVDSLEIRVMGQGSRLMPVSQTPYSPVLTRVTVRQGLLQAPAQWSHDTNGPQWLTPIDDG